MPLSITVADIEDGMVLHNPIRNSSGQILLSAGMTLLKSHANILKTWNIYSLTVEGGEDEANEVEITDNMKQKAKELLAERLTWTPSNEYEQEFYNLSLEHVIDIIKNK
jgi:hypothetical protein